MVLGLYYISLERKGLLGEGKSFASIEEVEHALEQGFVELHSKIIARIPQIDDQGLTLKKTIQTTPGTITQKTLPPKNQTKTGEINKT